MYNQFTGPKYHYPPDDELVELFREHGYIAAVAKKIDVPRGSLRGYLNRRPALKYRVEAVCWGRAGLNTKDKYVYPSDSELLGLVDLHRTLAKASAALGFPKHVLFEYVRRNSHLQEAVDEIRAADWCNQERQKEKRRESARRWHQDNPERVRELRRTNREQNRDRYRQAARDWYAKNKTRPSVKRNRYIRNHLQHTTRYTDQETLGFIELISDDPCSYCGETRGAMAVDHVDAVSRGGEHDWTNMTRACKPCNSSKRDSPLLTFLLSRRE